MTDTRQIGATPEQLDQLLAETTPPETVIEPEDVFLATQRGHIMGLIGMTNYGDMASLKAGLEDLVGYVQHRLDAVNRKAGIL